MPEPHRSGIRNGGCMNALITLENFALQPVDDKILALNEVSREYGLVLTAEDAKELSEIR